MLLGRNAVLALALMLGACGPSGGTDPGPQDAGQTPQLEPLAAYEETGAAGSEEFTSVSLDYSCLGARTRPVGGDPVSTTFQLRDFQDDFEVDGADVWVFTNNVIADECAGADCQAITTDSMGNATVSLPAGGWYAYRVVPKMGLSDLTTIFGVFQYNEPAPSEPDQAVIGNSVSGSTIDLIPALLGISRTEGLAVVAGRIEDCAGGFVQNAIIRMYDPDGNPVMEGELNDQPHFHYFNGDAQDNLPEQTRQRSHADGLYVLVQIPVVSDGPYRVEAWGNLDGETTLLACEAARIFPDAVTILNLTPLREDGPAGCAP